MKAVFCVRNGSVTPREEGFAKQPQVMLLTPREEGFAKQPQVMLLGGWSTEDVV
jgi:hypothetical protein